MTGAKPLAVVSLNSLYTCGESTFFKHLIDGSFDAYAVNATGSPLVSDMDVRGVRYISKGNAVDVLGKYPAVFIISTEYFGDYDYLRGLKSKVGILIHDTPTFVDNNFGGLVDALDKSGIVAFCLDGGCAAEFSRRGFKNAMMLVQPFSADGILSNDGDREHFFFCHSRFSRFKYPDVVARIFRSVPQSFELRFKVSSFKNPHLKSDIFFDPRISFSFGTYNWETIRQFLCRSIGCPDGSAYPMEHTRMQYTFLEAIQCGSVVLCDSGWFSNELVDGETALELTRENVEMLLDDSDLAVRISGNALDVIGSHNPLRTINSIRRGMGLAD